MSLTCNILFAVPDSPYIILMFIIRQLFPLAKFSREENEKLGKKSKEGKNIHTKLHKGKPINFLNIRL